MIVCADGLRRPIVHRDRVAGWQVRARGRSRDNEVPRRRRGGRDVKRGAGGVRQVRGGGLQHVTAPDLVDAQVAKPSDAVHRGDGLGPGQGRVPCCTGVVADCDRHVACEVGDGLALVIHCRDFHRRRDRGRARRRVIGLDGKRERLCGHLPKFRPLSTAPRTDGLVTARGKQHRRQKAAESRARGACAHLPPHCWVCAARRVQTGCRAPAATVSWSYSEERGTRGRRRSAS